MTAKIDRNKIDRTSGSADDGFMEARISKLESLAAQTLERISSIEVDIAVIRSNYATKEDIAKMEGNLGKMEGNLLKWFIGTAVTLASLAFAAAKFIR